MTVVTDSFETGVNGATVATSDAGSATVLNVVTIGAGSALTYDNTHPAHGSLGAKLVTAASQNCAFGWDAALGAQATTWFGRFYLFFTAAPPAAFDLIMPCSGSYAIGSRSALMQLTTAPKVNFTDSASANGITSTTTLSTSTLYRVEWKIVQSATTGQLEFKLFLGDNAAALETQTSGSTANTRASSDRIAHGWIRSGAVPVFTHWLDNVVDGATAYPGPFPVNTVAPGVTGLVPVGSTLTCDGGTWNGTFTLTYQWTRDGASIGGATASTYVTQAADVGHAIGCTVTATGVQATNESASQASSNTVTPAAASSLPSSGIRSHGRGRDRF